MVDLMCSAGMKPVAGPAKETDPEGTIAPFCIDEHEVTQSEFEAYEAERAKTKFELVQKDCATGAEKVVRTTETVEELLVSSEETKVDGERVCGVEIRRQAPPATDRPKPEGKFSGPMKPAIYVNWYEARAYCQAKGGDLPTGDQWEKAARGPKGNIYATKSGANMKEEANVDSRCTVDVMSYPPNGYGLYDMEGNVSEWVLDEATVEDHRFEDELGSSYADVRGSNWSWDQRASDSLSDWVVYRRSVTGFRCVAAPLNEIEGPSQGSEK